MTFQTRLVWWISGILLLAISGMAVLDCRFWDGGSPLFTVVFLATWSCALLATILTIGCFVERSPRRALLLSGVLFACLWYGVTTALHQWMDGMARSNPYGKRIVTNRSGWWYHVSVAEDALSIDGSARVLCYRRLALWDKIWIVELSSPAVAEFFDRQACTVTEVPKTTPEIVNGRRVFGSQPSWHDTPHLRCYRLDFKATVREPVWGWAIFDDSERRLWIWTRDAEPRLH